MAHRPTSRAAGKAKRTKARGAVADTVTRKAKAPAKAATKSKVAKPPATKSPTARSATAKRKSAKPAAAKTKAKAPTASTTRAAAAASRATKPASKAKTPAKSVAKSPAAKAAARKSASSKSVSPKVAAAKSKAATAPAKKIAQTKPTLPKAAKPRPRKAPRASEQPYLAAELGQPIDHEGEPIGAGSTMAQSDIELQRYSLELWRQMQSRRVANRHVLAMERSGVTIDDLWTAGVTDRLTTSSTEDEVRRYRQNLLFRANLLESILSETVAELRRLETVEPSPSIVPNEAPPSPTAHGPS